MEIAVASTGYGGAETERRTIRRIQTVQGRSKITVNSPFQFKHLSEYGIKNKEREKGRDRQTGDREKEGNKKGVLKESLPVQRQGRVRVTVCAFSTVFSCVVF